MTEMFGEAWSPMSVPDLAPDDDDELGLKERLLVDYTFPVVSGRFQSFPVVSGITRHPLTAASG